MMGKRKRTMRRAMAWGFPKNHAGRRSAALLVALGMAALQYTREPVFADDAQAIVPPLVGTTTQATPATMGTPATSPAQGKTDLPTDKTVIVPGPVAPANSLGPTGSTPIQPVGPAGVAPPVSPPTPTAVVPATEPSNGSAVAATSQPLPAVATTAAASDGRAYPVSGIILQYDRTAAGEPSVADLSAETVELGHVADGFVAPRAGVQTVKLRIDEIGKGGAINIYGSAFDSIYKVVIRSLNRHGLIGVFVVADPKEISGGAKGADSDQRPEGQSTLHIMIYTAQVKQVRTVSTVGSSSAARVDLPEHAGIRDHSPVKPGDQGLLRKDLLDDYVLFLDRHPGRRVDVAVSNISDKPGDVLLDYLVAESRPWYVYAQVSNTGTAETRPWRERFGFVENQLTHHDDILSLDYSTAGFDRSQAVQVSYDFPIFNLDKVRNKVYGNWDKFTASDVGLADEEFTGNSWTAGDEVAWNFFQQRALFLDAVIGGHFEHIEVTDQTFNNEGTGNFWLPYAGIRMARSTDLYATTGDLSLITGFSNSPQAELDALGRPGVDQNFVAFQGQLIHSFFLEPLLEPQEFQQGKGSLAHELFFSARGQYAFDHRLVPQFEEVAGGMYSVRGYAESVTAGDSVIVGTAEYRFHVPRAFGIEADPAKTRLPITGEPFRFRPQQLYGRADWDLILRTFVDAGYTVNSERVTAFEHNQTLVGTGVGVEFQFKQNFNVRADWGIALHDVEQVTDGVTAGSNRFHLAFTLLY